LADALERIHAVANRGIVRSASMSRTDRSLLLKQGYLTYIMKGWYFLSSAAGASGESTAWFAVFWDFLSVYLQTRFDKKYCLSAVSSLHVHAGTNTVPNQIIVTSEHGGKSVLELTHNISLLIYEERNGTSKNIQTLNDLRVMPIGLTLCRLSAASFRRQQLDIEIAIQSLKSVSDLIRNLLSGGHVAAAQRLAGAYEFIGKPQIANEIVSSMKAAGHNCRPSNPFINAAPILPILRHNVSPYAARITALFSSMREIAAAEFIPMMQKSKNIKTYLQHIDDIYVHDAYNSLSIEGYQVTPDLIRRIRSEDWDPAHNIKDRDERNAMAAKGYLEAFRATKKTVSDILNGKLAINAVQEDYGQWYRELFSPSVQVGILKPHHLAGFRSNQVYIRGSRHIPPPPSAVQDSIDMFFEELKKEESCGVKAVLSHFVFTFIHPYMDENGRMARFLMNAMMAADGMPWTIIRVSKRQQYMDALESASCKGDIKPFARLIIQESTINWEKENQN